MGDVVLSLFPGIGLLDRAFEEEGYIVVRGPDLLWGGDVRQFHVPPGRFDGVIGGTPCQAFSQMTHMVRANGYRVAPNLIPEFERIVAEAQPTWFLMENVRNAPVASVPGYTVHAPLFDNRWIGGEQSRLHRFSFGTRDGRELALPTERIAPSSRAPRVQCTNGRVKIGGSGKVKPTAEAPRMTVDEAKRLQGLPPEWDLPSFTVAGKLKALGNAVPLPMGRAVARAVRRSFADPTVRQTIG